MTKVQQLRADPGSLNFSGKTGRNAPYALKTTLASYSGTGSHRIGSAKKLQLELGQAKEAPEERRSASSSASRGPSFRETFGLKPWIISQASCLKGRRGKTGTRWTPCCYSKQQGPPSVQLERPDCKGEKGAKGWTPRSLVVSAVSAAQLPCNWPELHATQVSAVA